MDLFDSFVKDFNDTIQIADDKIISLSYLSGDEKKEGCREIESIIEDAEQIVNSMSLAIRTVSSKSQADEMQKSLNGYKSKIKSLRKQLQNAQYESDRISLLGTDDDMLTSMRNRTEMLTGTQRLERSSDVINATIQRAEGAYNTGADTLVQLETDSERINRAREKMSGIRDRMGEARSMLRRIEGRMTVNKLMKGVIIFTLILFIGLIIYFRWIRGITGSPKEPVPQPSPPSNQTIV